MFFAQVGAMILLTYNNTLCHICPTQECLPAKFIQKKFFLWREKVSEAWGRSVPSHLFLHIASPRGTAPCGFLSWANCVPLVPPGHWATHRPHSRKGTGSLGKVTSPQWSWFLVFFYHSQASCMLQPKCLWNHLSPCLYDIRIMGR